MSGEQRPRIDAETYRRAAGERLTAAALLYNAEDYATSIYLSGRAAESMLRAYRVRIDPTIESGHDLYVLFVNARFADGLLENHRRASAEAVSFLSAVWRNDHRFRDYHSMLRQFQKASLHRQRWVKGDPMKAIANRTLNGAASIVNLGESRWSQSSTT